MDLVLLVGGGLAAVLATWELARRAQLGNRMDRSFEILKVGMRQMASPDDVVIRRAPVRGAVLIKAVRHDQGPKASYTEAPAELLPTRVRHVPLHARRAS
jgi:hypothetical protein